VREGVTPLEYWLLDCVVEWRFPLAALVSPNLDELINRPGHGADEADLVEALAGLFRRGLIVADKGSSGPDLALRADEVERALDDALGAGYAAWTYYGLSPAGGKAWEDLSSPRWDRYVGYFRGYLEDGTWMDEVTGMDPDLVERCRGHVRRMYLEGAPDPRPATRDEIRPWTACYWKLLPHAYRLVYFGRDEFKDPAFGTPEKPFAEDPEFATGGPAWYTRRFEGVAR